MIKKVINNTGFAILFDYQGEEKILLPSKSYKLKINPYIQVLIDKNILISEETKK